MSSRHAIAFCDGNLIPDEVEYQQPIQLRADPSCLAYDRQSDKLYVADAYGGAIFQVDGERQRRIATIEAGGVIGTDRIGGLAVSPHGTLFASRLGHGEASAVFRIEPDGRMEALQRLSPRRWRGGLAYDAADHALYATQFMRSRSGPFDGAIVELDLVTGESTMVADGLLHPVDLVKLGQTLVVTDARQCAVLRIELGGARRPVLLATEVDRPDSICVCGDDSVLVTTYDDATNRGTVRRIWLDGEAYIIAKGEWEPRGVATDGERVFVAVRRASRVMVFRL